MPTTDRTAPTTSTSRGPVYGTSWTSLMPDSTTAMIDDLEDERDPPGQEGGDEAAEQRPDGGGDRRRGADQGVDLLLRRALEVAVDERLHRRQQQRRAEPADDRPEDDDRGQALGQGHRQRADRVAEQTQHVGPLAADQVADLAADQDERRRHQRLQRDRRLHAADRRVQVAGPPPRSTRSSTRCRPRARTSPSPAAAPTADSAAPPWGEPQRLMPQPCDPTAHVRTRPDQRPPSFRVSSGGDRVNGTAAPEPAS